MCNAAPRIPNLNQHALLQVSRGYREPAQRLVPQSPLRILGEIQKHLHEALPVSPYWREVLIHLPIHLYPFVQQRTFNDDAQLLKK